jgi:hypothetical protein
MGMRCFALTPLRHGLTSIRASRGCARRRDPLLPGILSEGARTGRIALLAGVDEPQHANIDESPQGDARGQPGRDPRLHSGWPLLIVTINVVFPT